MAEPGRTLVITGPTASGKTALALAVAERIGGEIISMDSRQVYRGMDIGTAKPSDAERSRVPHHGLDLIDPGHRYSAGQFARDARAWIADIEARGHAPLVAGGTLFFLRALQEPLFDEPPMDIDTRERLRQRLMTEPTARLRAWAAVLNPALGPEGRPVDRQRLARLIEVATLTGRPLSWWHMRAPAHPPVATVTFVMELDRATLYDRINRRVSDMMDAGFADEVRALLEQGYSGGQAGMNATGYVELLDWLAGNTTLPEATENIRAATRRYARRQLTWLRTQLGQDVIRLDARQPIDALADRVIKVWREEAQ